MFKNIFLWRQMMRNKSNIHHNQTAQANSSFTLIQDLNETNLFDNIQHKLNIDGSILKINENIPGTRNLI